MSFKVTVPVHEQDAFDETLDQSVTEQYPAAADGTVDPVSPDDRNLLDYAIRKAKEIMADAPIVATHIVAEISGHANNGGNVFQPGTGVSPGLTIAIHAAGEVPAVPVVQQQVQSAHALGAATPEGGIVGQQDATSPAPADAGGLAASGEQAVPTQASPSVTSTEDETVPSDAPAEESVEPAGAEEAEIDPATGQPVPASGGAPDPLHAGDAVTLEPATEPPPVA